VQNIPPVRFILNWIPRQEKIYLSILTLMQIFAGLLDLLSIIGVSLLAGAYISPMNQVSLGNSISRFIPLVSFTDGDSVVKFILFSVFFLLALKGVLSLMLNRLLLLRLSQISKEVSNKKFRQLLNQPLNFSKSTNKVELGYSLSDGVTVLFIGIISALVAFICEVSLILILSAGLVFVNKGIGVFVLVYFLFIILALSKFLGKRIDKSASDFVLSSIAARTSVNDTLFLFREIKVMAKSKFFLDRYTNSAHVAAAGYSDLIWWQQMPKFIYEIALLSALALLGIFSWFVLDQDQALLLGMTFAVAAFKMVPAILRLQAANLTLRDFQGRAREVFPLLSSLEMVNPFFETEVDIKGSDRLRLPPKIELRNVSYGYTSDSEIINDLSYIFEPGALTYLVGKSGAGKTTLCDLVLNFLTPTAGEILFDGRSFLDWSKIAEQRIALMPQEPHFFIGTIRENLLMDLDEDSHLDSEIHRLISKLDLHDHIASLPDGLDTVITDRNLQFSGGQKQRLAIVRTLLMRPNLCIIDEGTSALDVQTEKATEMLLGELVGNCTLIRIAHKKILHLEPDARVLNL
jgi:ABC-type bacteriocin/lantibiotic exporter with double-glycine peptidase domain